jgi:predicted phage terminase large subunit-like protein
MAAGRAAEPAREPDALAARGSRLATSVGGTLTGRGGNLLIIDDPLKPQDAHSESARDSLKQWYANTLLSRLDNKVDGSIIVVMQRLHPDDLVGHLLEQGGWTHLNLPAIAEDETMVPLDPGRHYLRAPAAQHGDKLIISWDTALSSSQLADYSACVVLLVRGESIFILEVMRARLEYPDLKKTVLQHYNRWRLSACPSCNLLVEKKGSGLSLIQDLRRDNIHAIGINPDGDKIMRMAAQSASIEAGAVHLPINAPWLDEFKKEILAFPTSKHDDQIDALSQALQRANAPPPPMPVFGRHGSV